jgi:hypothetical protein
VKGPFPVSTIVASVAAGVSAFYIARMPGLALGLALAVLLAGGYLASKRGDG